jgi:sulfite reductase (NADPH) flavoprotein alpha-component
VKLVRYQSHNRSRRGVCSAFLADRASGPVPVFIQISRTFRLPAKDDVPIVMVGPGTGVAPFRAFLQERSQKPGKNWLFFGEQRAATNFFIAKNSKPWLRPGI